MRSLFSLVLFFLALATRLHAAVPFASELVTVSTSAIGVTSTLCRTGGATGPSTSALIEIITGTINYLIHDPTATPDATGHSLTVGGVLELVDPYKFRAVRNGGSDATIRITCIDRLQENRISKRSTAGGSGDITAVIAGDGLAGGATTGDATLTLIDCAANQILKRNAGDTAWECAADATGGSPSFDLIAAGTNTTAAMVVGSGGTLGVSGTGTITANRTTCTGTNYLQFDGTCAASGLSHPQAMARVSIGF